MQKMNSRRNRIGGSDVPVIMGDSKFKDATQLFLEKIGAIEVVFTGSMYTELGNILEPKIQELYNTADDQKWVSKPIDNFNFGGYIDGTSGEELVEIKVTSSDNNQAKKDYYAQIQTYLYMTDLKQCKLIVCHRTDEIKEMFNEVREAHKLPHLHEFGNYHENVVATIKSDLTAKFAGFKLLKKHCSTMTIKRDDDYINNEMLPKIQKFINIINSYYENMFDIEDAKKYFENQWLEKEPEELIEAAATVEILQTEYNQTAKPIEEKLKLAKEHLMDMMNKFTKKSVATSNFKFTFVQAVKIVETEIFDQKMFEAEEQEIIKEYEEAAKVFEEVEKRYVEAKQKYTTIQSDEKKNKPSLRMMEVQE